MNNRDLSKNASGIYDPTAYKAIKNIKDDSDADRFYKLLDAIFSICELAGFHIEGRITIRDKKTGKVWR